MPLEERRMHRELPGLAGGISGERNIALEGE